MRKIKNTPLKTKGVVRVSSSKYVDRSEIKEYRMMKNFLMLLNQYSLQLIKVQIIRKKMLRIKGDQIVSPYEENDRKVVQAADRHHKLNLYS